jgi:tellurite resistance protein TehA-like permease
MRKGGDQHKLATWVGLGLLAGRMTARPGGRAEPLARPPSEPPSPPLPKRAARLFPGHFSMVMGTGIVSVDAAMLGWRQIGLALFAVNIAAWLLFWALGLLRIGLEPRGTLRALRGHESGAAFLAVVAGTAVFGTQFSALHIAGWALAPLFGMAGALWWITVYGFLSGVTEGETKPGLEHGFNGEWLFIVVATESLASLGASLIRHAATPPAGLVFMCYMLVLSGGVYYFFIGSIILYRFGFAPMRPKDITGPWWISQSAAALVVLAGCKLIAIPGLKIGTFAINQLLPPIVTLFWADASFWIPLVALMFAWKYLKTRKLPAYSVSFWSVVFPIGMYAAATLKLASTFAIPFLHPLGYAFFWIALVIWAVSLMAAAGHLVRSVRTHPA